MSGRLYTVNKFSSSLELTEVFSLCLFSKAVMNFIVYLNSKSCVCILIGYLWRKILCIMRILPIEAKSEALNAVARYNKL